MAQNALYLAEKREHHNTDDAEALEVLFREVRQRVELEAAFRADGKCEMANREAQEIVVLQEFLPPPLSPAELDTLIERGIAQTGAVMPRDAHKVATSLSADLCGRADPRTVCTLINHRLASRQDCAPNAATKS
jgi:uncharacterized protein YqeY